MEAESIPRIQDRQTHQTGREGERNGREEETIGRGKEKEAERGFRKTDILGKGQVSRVHGHRVIQARYERGHLS